MYPSFAYSLFLKPDGQNIAYKILGNRNETIPLVLIHGLSGVGLIDWSPLAEALAATGRTVLIFDNRGVGGSTMPKEMESNAYDVQDMANDVIDLIKHVGFKKVDILAYSMGGMIAQTLLVSPHLPFAISHCILAATSAKAAHSDLLASIPSSATPITTLQQKIDLVRPFVYIGYDPAFVKDPKNKALLDQRVEESVNSRRPSKTMSRQLAVIAGYDVRSKLPSIPSTLPVLVIHGKLDRSVYFSERKYIEKGIKHCQLATLPNDDIGHAWYDYFTTDFWVTMINNFLDDKPEAMVYKIQKSKL